MLRKIEMKINIYNCYYFGIFVCNHKVNCNYILCKVNSTSLFSQQQSFKFTWNEYVWHLIQLRYQYHVFKRSVYRINTKIPLVHIFFFSNAILKQYFYQFLHWSMLNTLAIPKQDIIIYEELVLFLREKNEKKYK